MTKTQIPNKDKENKASIKTTKTKSIAKNICIAAPEELSHYNYTETDIIERTTEQAVV